MSIRRFEELKETLQKIEVASAMLPAIQEKIDAENSKLDPLVSKLAELNVKYEKANREYNDKPKEVLIEKESELEELRRSKKEKKSLMHKKFQSLGGKSWPEFMKAKPHEEGRHGSGPITFIFVLAVIISLVIGVSIMVFAITNDWTDEEWICDNGETIELEELLNDEEDCSDGSDEEREFWGSSRAEEDEDDTHALLGMGTCLGGVIVMLVLAALSNELLGPEKMMNKINLRVMKKDEEWRNYLLSTKFSHVRDNFNYHEDLVQDIDAKILTVKREIGSLKGVIVLPEKISSARKEVDNKRARINRLNSEFEEIEHVIWVYWDSISDLIPGYELERLK